MIEAPHLCTVAPARIEGGYSEQARLHKAEAPLSLTVSMYENKELLALWLVTIYLVIDHLLSLPYLIAGLLLK